MPKRNITAQELQLFQETLMSKTLFDNEFLNFVFEDVGAVETVIRTILGRDDLEVKEVITERTLANMEFKGVRLDVLASDKDDKLYNIEIQNADNDDHAKRVRSYAAALDRFSLQKGAKYDELPETYIIFITRNDFMGTGKAMSRVEKRLDNGMEYDDGMHYVFVNGAVNDGSSVAELMEYFQKADPHDMRFGALSKTVHEMKVIKMNGDEVIMSEKQEKALTAWEQMVLSRGKQEKLIDALKSLMKTLGCDLEKALEALEASEDEKIYARQMINQ